MSKDQSKDHGFSRLRAALWPIHFEELKRFIPMSIMMFCVIFVYTIGRNVKDSLITGAPGSGAETLSYIKSWVVLPATFAFVILYAKLSNVLSKTALYYSCLLPFAIFFIVFGFFVYPYADSIHMDLHTLESLKAKWPGIQWAMPAIAYWSFSLFYALSEIWGNVGVAILFWQFANDITSSEDAGRHYPMFLLFGNLGQIVGASIMEHFSENGGSFRTTFQTMMVLTSVATVVLGVMYYITTRNIEGTAAGSALKKEKPKLSLSESFSYLSRSKYLGYIAILVIAYGVSINLVEISWKAKLTEYTRVHGNPDLSRTRYTSYYSTYQKWTGILAIILLYSGKSIIRALGWYVGAIITPVVLIVTAAAFFAFVLFGGYFDPLVGSLGMSALGMATFLGALQGLLSKSFKYATFDPTKEMAYIPTDQELKVKGKAAVDVFASRFGKSGGGYIIQLLLFFFHGTLGTIAPYLFIAVCITGAIWMWAVSKLSVEYNNLVAQREREKREHDRMASHRPGERPTTA